MYVISIQSYNVFFLEFCIKRDSKWGGDRVYTVFEDVEKDFAAEVLTFYTRSLQQLLTGLTFS